MHARALTIVAVLFLLSGGAALVGVATDLLFHQRVNLDFAVLNLWIGRWLLAHDSRGRKWAVVIIQLSLIFLPLAALVILFTDSTTELRVLGVPVGHISRILAFVFVAAVWALYIWLYRVLNRADVRAVFVEAPGTA